MKSVVICGSRRYKSEIKRFANGLIKLGATVYAPYLHEGKDERVKLSDQNKKFITLGLTHDHMYKIKMADVVYIYNKAGYSGVSTTMEIGIALALGKPIYAYSNKDNELCRHTLFREIIKSPKKLLAKLK
jgi:nucleoside 2-deoxyribosyltransferase